MAFVSSLPVSPRPTIREDLVNTPDANIPDFGCQDGKADANIVDVRGKPALER